MEKNAILGHLSVKEQPRLGIPTQRKTYKDQKKFILNDLSDRETGNKRVALRDKRTRTFGLRKIPNNAIVQGPIHPFIEKKEIIFSRNNSKENVVKVLTKHFVSYTRAHEQ